MTTANNPENHQNHAAQGSGQITDTPLPWVIVEKAGTDDESIYSDHATYRAAIQHAIEFLGAEFYEDGFDIMRRRDDGALTTEF